jgi:hypothetical protein
MFPMEDLDGDGNPEILFNYLTQQESGRRGAILCYESDGRLRWQFQPGRAKSLRDRTIDDDLSGHILRVVKIQKQKYVLISFTHKRWFPSQVVLVDPLSGVLLSEYWHPGALSHCLIQDLDGDGRQEAILAGINNPGQGPGHPALLVLTCPFPEGEPGKGPLPGLGEGKELSYFLFCRPDISTATGTLLLIDGLSVEPAGNLLVRLRLGHLDMKPWTTSVLFLFDGQFRLLDFQYSERIAPLHDSLWEKGLLTHRLTSTEAACWSRIHSFPTAPDGNDPAFSSLCSTCGETQSGN